MCFVSDLFIWKWFFDQNSLGWFRLRVGKVGVSAICYFFRNICWSGIWCNGFSFIGLFVIDVNYDLVGRQSIFSIFFIDIFMYWQIQKKTIFFESQHRNIFRVSKKDTCGNWSTRPVDMVTVGVVSGVWHTTTSVAEGYVLTLFIYTENAFKIGNKLLVVRRYRLHQYKPFKVFP